MCNLLPLASHQKLNGAICRKSVLLDTSLVLSSNTSVLDNMSNKGCHKKISDYFVRRPRVCSRVPLYTCFWVFDICWDLTTKQKEQSLMKPINFLLDVWFGIWLEKEKKLKFCGAPWLINIKNSFDLWANLIQTSSLEMHTIVMILQVASELWATKPKCENVDVFCCFIILLEWKLKSKLWISRVKWMGKGRKAFNDQNGWILLSICYENQNLRPPSPISPFPSLSQTSNYF